MFTVMELERLFKYVVPVHFSHKVDWQFKCHGDLQCFEWKRCGVYL